MFERQSMSNEDIIRVAIGGQGRSGYNIHAKWLVQDPARYRIVAVADQLPERRRDARREFGARAYDDWSRMITEADPTPKSRSTNSVRYR